jgi:uncharacterized membrane protein YfcA
MITLLLVLAAGVWAGAQNALAGGGSFVTLPTLILSGLDPRAANITSTIALFPGQVTTGWVGRKGATGAVGLSFRSLIVISLAGGACGAALLLLTPASFFARLVPWLVLFATTVFAWGSFFQKKDETAAPKLGRRGAAVAQFFIAVYGGYFGGGIGFLMLAALTFAGLRTHAAAATKNVLAGVMNASAVVIFCFFRGVGWRQGMGLAVGAVIGGLLGSWALRRVNEKALRVVVVIIGVALTIGLFLRRP